MQLNNEKVNTFNEELLKFDVTYIDVGNKMAKILFNGYNSYQDYYRYISKLELATHKEINSNLLFLTDEKSRTDYIIRLWRQSIYVNSQLSDTEDIIREELDNIDAIINYNGYMAPTYDLRFTLPPLDYTFVIDVKPQYYPLDALEKTNYKPVKIEKFIHDFNEVKFSHDEINGYFLMQIIKDAGIEVPKRIYEEEEENEIETRKSRLMKDKLSLKQQILLLQKVGILDNDRINQLTTQNKGILFSHLLNSSEKNTTEYIRNVHQPANNVSMDKYFIQTEENLQIVENLLEKVKFKKL